MSENLPESIVSTVPVKKKAMLDALRKTLGIVSLAAKKVGVTRQTHYNWLKADAQYRVEVENILEEEKDFAESHLHQLIQNGNPAATIFYLKTKAKDRGYVERIEQSFADETIEEVRVNIVRAPKIDEDA